VYVYKVKIEKTGRKPQYIRTFAYIMLFEDL